MTTRDRTVQFFEIVQAKTAMPRMSPQDWGGLLRSLRDRPLRDRMVTSGIEPLIGAIDPLQTAPHLILAKVRRDVPHQINFDDGTLSQLQLAANRGLVDVTTLHFLSFGNVVATLGGGISAPRLSAINRWLNGMQLFRDEVELRPVVNERSRDKLDRADAVDRVSVKIQPEAYDSSSALRSSSDLGDAVSRMHEQYPEMTVTLTLEVPKRGGMLSNLRRNRGQHRLLEATRALASDIDDWLSTSDVVESARVEAHIVEFGEVSKEEQIDFVAERITAKCAVPDASTDGHSIDIHIALTRLVEVSRRLERELRAAVGADV